jgi:hypothetical protein
MDLLVTYSRYISERHDQLMHWLVITAGLLQQSHQDVRIHGILRQICETTRLSIAELLDWAKEVLWINVIEAPNEESLMHWVLNDDETL